MNRIHFRTLDLRRVNIGKLLLSLAGHILVLAQTAAETGRRDDHAGLLL